MSGLESPLWYLLREYQSKVSCIGSNSIHRNEKHPVCIDMPKNEELRYNSDFRFKIL